MARRANHRLLCLVIALLFALGSVAQVYATTSVLMKMSTPSMEASDHDGDMGGMGCDGKDKATHASCVALCATAVAICNEPVAMTLAVTTQEIEPGPATPLRSLGLSPEPPPPKA